MKYFALAALLAIPCLGATLVTLNTGSSAATVALLSFPLGSNQIAIGVGNLPTTAPVADLPLFIILTDVSGKKITCEIPANTLNISCFNTNDAFGNGAVSLPLPAGQTAVRLVMTQQKDGTYGQISVDLWGDDCSEIGASTISPHLWGVMPSLDQGMEPSTTSQQFSLGGNNLSVRFFRAANYPSGGVQARPLCPADVLATPAPNIDFRFEGNSLVDVSGNAYTLTATGSSFASSTTYNPIVQISGNWTAPRPVIEQVAVSLVCNVVLSDGNVTAGSYTWSNQSASDIPPGTGYTPVTGSFSSTNTATTTFTPTNDGSFWPRCAVTDTSSNPGHQDFNIGVVNSDANGNKIETNLELGWIENSSNPGRPVPRYGSSPWPWFEYTEAADLDVIRPFWYATPMAGTTVGSISGASNVYFSARGPFTGDQLTDVYGLKICATGTPDSYCWRKNGGSYSSAIPITEPNCVGNPRVMPVTDGVIACFNGISTGHTLNDVFTLMIPQAGTATISGASPNHIDPTTGYVCGGSVNCFSTPIVVVGTGTHWLTGTPAQALVAGNYYWFEWDYLGNGSNQGRFYLQVASVDDDTHIKIYGNSLSWPIPVSQSSGMTIQTTGLDFHLYYGVDSSVVGSSINYYDSGLAAIRMAESSNLDVYTSEAQAWCNNWWQFGADHGANVANPPRNSGYKTLMACASKFGYSWWGVQPSSVGPVPGTLLAYYMTYWGPSFNNYASSAIGRDTIPNSWGIRESAFWSDAVAIFTHVYPAHTGSPMSTLNTWCTYSKDLTNNTWLNPWVGSGGLLTYINSGQDAYWQDNLVGAPVATFNSISSPTIGIPAGNYAPSVYGSSTWRDDGIGNIGLIDLQAVLANPSDCNLPTDAANAKAAALKIAAHIKDYGTSPDHGQNYNVNFLTNGLNEPAGNVLHNIPYIYADAGSLTVSGGVNVVADFIPNLNYAFTRRFGPCNGTTSIALGPVGSSTNFQVDACPDDYHLTLHTSATNGSYGFWFNPASVSVTNGSTTLTGSSSGSTKTGFQSLFAPASGTTYIGIPGVTQADNGVYQITSCSSQTNCTISPAWSGANQTTQDFVYTTLASTNCSPAIAGGTCEPDFYSGKNLAGEIPFSLAQKYLWTSNSIDKNNLEYALGGIYAGPQYGPAFLGPLAGPQGYIGPADFDYILPVCATTAKTIQPCGQVGGSGMTDTNHLTKEFGAFAGSGNALPSIAADNVPLSSTGGLSIFGQVRATGNISIH